MLRYSDHQIGHGPAFLRQACSFELEGIVSKRRTEPYRPGRSRSWLKVKCRNREEFVVVGFTDPEGSREGFGALLVGYYDPQGKLRYAGRVGTGFNDDAARSSCAKRLESLVRAGSARSPCPKGVSRKGVHWIEPRLVAEVEFADWTADAILRHASFQGLREDKDAERGGLRSEITNRCRARHRAQESPDAAEASRATEAGTSRTAARPRRQRDLRGCAADPSRPHPLSRARPSPSSMSRAITRR